MRKIFYAIVLGCLVFGTSLGLVGKGNIAVSPVPPSLDLSIKFVEPSGNNILDADEAGKIVLTVKNSGK
ncbi:MAG: hypothetical protein JW943_10910 [Deltaproteobacteria bacterium]|nr:hypothetical protein [Deltaproteobacteria bacterium]